LRVSRSNQESAIEEGQTTQWPKEKDNGHQNTEN
jgi:hypothetical protein